ncbi:MAG: malate synthase A [Bacteriovoracaceae bacterium]
MSRINLETSLTFPKKYWSNDIQEVFTDSLINLLISLHRKFESKRIELINQRFQRQKEFDMGKVPEFLASDSEAVHGSWKISPLPTDLLCRRVEITAPVNSAKMIINMFNRNELGARADMGLLDFEDTIRPTFGNILSGYKNVIATVNGTLQYNDEINTYKLNPSDMAYPMIRPRGLHLNEDNILIENYPISAGLLDLTVCFFHTAHILLEQNKNPKYYIPKCEHYLEARWWNDLFTELEEALHIPVGKLKATFLIETLPAAFQVEEILFEIRDHAAGLNVGRWDKIFSDIKILRNHPHRVMADRSTITMDRPWMENYAKRVIKICHERGALALGGMTPVTPGKTPEIRKEQIEKVFIDKKREAEWGHDGCCVSHPYFIGPALEAFPFINQLNKTLPSFDKYSNILPQGIGPYTLDGLRTNIRVGIVYMYGWQKDSGRISIDNRIEDLATLEISRVQVWQWLHHHIKLIDGTKVTTDLVKRIFLEEYEKLLAQMKKENSLFSINSLESDLKQARDVASDLFLAEELTDFLTLSSEEDK